MGYPKNVEVLKRASAASYGVGKVTAIGSKGQASGGRKTPEATSPPIVSSNNQGMCTTKDMATVVKEMKDSLLGHDSVVSIFFKKMEALKSAIGRKSSLPEVAHSMEELFEAGTAV